MGERKPKDQPLQNDATFVSRPKGDHGVPIGVGRGGVNLGTRRFRVSTTRDRKKRHMFCKTGPFQWRGKKGAVRRSTGRVRY